jgi:hypothetical protein
MYAQQTDKGSRGLIVVRCNALDHRLTIEPGHRVDATLAKYLAFADSVAEAMRPSVDGDEIVPTVLEPLQVRGPAPFERRDRGYPCGGYLIDFHTDIVAHPRSKWVCDLVVLGFGRDGGDGKLSTKTHPGRLR